jgi:hypothetical protein
MTGVFTLLGFVAQLKAIEHDMHELGPAIVAKACKMVCDEAKRVIGGYDYDWPQLKPETIARKMLGNSPLLETGEMRASIEWQAHGLEGAVGSNNDKAVWQELGTSRIPPRSFLVGAAKEMEEKIHKMAARAVVAVMLGKGLHGSEMGELIHLLRHVGHAVKEAADKFLDGPEEDNGRHRCPPAEWEARIMAVVDDLGLFLASEPDAKVDASLARMRRNLNAEFLRVFPGAPPETMAAGVDCIVAEIQKRRREIEAASATPPVLN